MLGKFEKKVINLKNKINKKVLSIIIFAIFGGFIIFSLNMTNSYKRQKQITEDAYNKALYDMIGYVNNFQVELAKLKVVSTPSLMESTLAGVWRYSNLSKENLNILPLEQNNIANTSKFLTQLSDFSYSLVHKLSKGEVLTKEDDDNLDLLYTNSKKLSDTMNEIYKDLNEGRIKWNELKYVGNEKLNNDNIDTDSLSSVDGIGKDFQEYEGLIYDGAFSEHILSTKAKSLSETVLPEEKVRENLNKMFENEIENIEFLGESDGRVMLYNYNVKFKEYENPRSISMTKQDGKLYLMVSDMNAENENISMNDAKKIGMEFLSKIGINDVKDTYYLKDSNMAIINYAGVYENVTLYPDLVKVKVSLDTGEVCSVEVQGYIFNHVERENIVPKVSIEEAKKLIKNKEYILSYGLAIIPTDYQTEILTYEFKGKIDDTEFLVYINAYTGIEEKVLLILDTPGGILTI